MSKGQGAMVALALASVMLAWFVGHKDRSVIRVSQLTTEKILQQSRPPGRNADRILTGLARDQHSTSMLIELLASQHTSIALAAVQALHRHLDHMTADRGRANCEWVVNMARKLAETAEQARLPTGAVEELTLRLLQWPFAHADCQTATADQCLQALRTTARKSRL